MGKAALWAPSPGPEDLILCADGGLRHVLACGLLPHALIGDGDSGGLNPPLGVEVIRLPTDKDITDTQACIDHGLARGYREFLLLGCSGGPRLDHFLGNLGLLEYCAEHGACGKILDEKHLILLHTGGRMVLPEAWGYRFFSLFALDRRVTGVTLEGLRFPLRDATLERAAPLAVSNQPLYGNGPVSVTLTGRALVILCG